MNTICLSFCLRCVVLDVSNCLKLYQHWIKVSTSTNKVTKDEKFFYKSFKWFSIMYISPNFFYRQILTQMFTFIKIHCFFPLKCNAMSYNSIWNNTFFMQPMRLLMLLIMGMFSLPSLPPRKRALEAR